MKVIGADIGGTHTRLEVFEQHGAVLQSLHHARFINRDYRDLKTLLQQFMQESNAAGVTAIGLALAGPVVGERVKLTNIDWQVDAVALSQSLAGVKVFLINDFAAIPYGIADLADEDIKTLHQGEPQSEATQVVIGPGTGLGVTLAPMINGQRFALPSEAGHSDFAPSGSLQLALLSTLYEQQQGPVCNESLLSGRGLINIYHALSQLGHGDAAPRIVLGDTDAPRKLVASLDDDPLARLSLDTFFDVLAAYAGNVALQTLPHGGLFLGGGILPRVVAYIDPPRFVEMFQHKAEFRSLLATIPIHVILNEGVARWGAARFALSQCRD